MAETDMMMIGVGRMLTVTGIEKIHTVKGRKIEGGREMASMAKVAGDPGQEKRGRNRKSHEKEVHPTVIHTIQTIPSVLMILLSLLLSWS